MIKEEFSYESRDGLSKIHAVRYLPDYAEDIRAVVQIVHGMAEYVERYEKFAKYMTSKGFIVTGEDHMGHGKSIGKKGKCGYFCEQDPATVLVRDVHRLKKKTQDEYPDIPYILIGHSMGSFIVRNYIARYGSGIDGAIILGTGMQSIATLRVSKTVAWIQKLFLGSEHVSKFMDRGGFGNYNERIPDHKTDYDWLSRDENCVEKYIADPMCGFVFTVNGFQALFELIYRLHNPDALKMIPSKLPVLFLSGSGDPVGDYGKGVQRAYESLRAAGLENVGMKLYPGARHELLNEINKDEVYEDICRWIDSNILAKEEEKITEMP